MVAGEMLWQCNRSIVVAIAVTCFRIYIFLYLCLCMSARKYETPSLMTILIA